MQASEELVRALRRAVADEGAVPSRAKVILPPPRPRVFVEPRAPRVAQCRTGRARARLGNRARHGFVEHLGAAFVRHVVCRTLGRDAQARRLRRGIDVGAYEQELPAHPPMLLDHVPDLRVRVATARVLLTVGGDDEEHPVRLVARGLHALDQINVPDGAAHGVEQRRTPAALVVAPREPRHLADVEPGDAGGGRILRDPLPPQDRKEIG